MEEYKRQQALFSAQPAIVQRFLEVQGKQIAEAIVEGDSQVHFSLPDRMVCTLENVDQPALVTIPQNQRAYSAGSFMNRLRKVELYKELRHSLDRVGAIARPRCICRGEFAASRHCDAHGLSTCFLRDEP